jgi:hypothetical protein
MYNNRRTCFGPIGPSSGAGIIQGDFLHVRLKLYLKVLEIMLCVALLSTRKWRFNYLVISVQFVLLDCCRVF